MSTIATSGPRSRTSEEQRVGVTACADDLEAPSPEEPCHALADEGRVVGDSRSARYLRGEDRSPAGSARYGQRRRRRCEPVGEAARPAAARRDRRRRRRRRHGRPRGGRCSRSSVTVACEARACFATFVSASETKKYVASSIARERGPPCADYLDRNRRPARERFRRPRRGRPRAGRSDGFPARTRAAPRAPARDRPAPARAARPRPDRRPLCARLSLSESPTSRCCAPSWRSRSRR